MTTEEFRELVYTTFGNRLEHATPELMRDFITGMYARLSPLVAGGTPLELPDDHADSYEQVITEFLARILAVSPDHAVVLLWLFAAEMFYDRLADDYAAAFNDLVVTEVPDTDGE